MPQWLINDQYLNSRRIFSTDNFDHDPNTVSPYDAMGTPTPTGWSPIFPPASADTDIY